MLNLKHLTDDTLISETKRLVREESERLAILLSHLNEIERRRLYTNFHCETIHEYAMKELKYSRDEAQRRVTAMFAIRGVPEVEEGSKNGELSLTHITYAQSLFSNEEDKGRKFDAEKKAEVFQAISGLSTREAKVALCGYSPEAPKIHDRVEPLGNGRNRFTFEGDDELYEILKNLKALRGEKIKCMADLLRAMAEEIGDSWDPGKAPKQQKKENSKAEVIRQVWRRDQNKCTKCGSRRAVEVDHVHPKSMGGDDSLDNLRLLCRHCNQRAAIEKLGQEKMDPFLNPHAAPRFRRSFKDREPLDRDRPSSRFH